jgi:hypothetical protein
VKLWNADLTPSFAGEPGEPWGVTRSLALPKSRAALVLIVVGVLAGVLAAAAPFVIGTQPEATAVTLGPPRPTMLVAPVPRPAPVAAPAAPPTPAPAAPAVADRNAPPPPVIEIEPAEDDSVRRARIACERADRALAAGDLDTAERLYQDALASSRRYAPARRGLGQVYAQDGSEELARAMFKSYLAVAPDAGDADQVRHWLRQLEHQL